MSKTWYIFSPLFFLHCFSQVATNCMFNLETCVMLPIIKCLPLNAKRNLFVKSVKHKLEGTFFHGSRRVFQLEQLFLLSVPISQQLPVLPLFYFLVFSNDPCKLTLLFVDNSQVVLSNEPLLEAGKSSLASNKRQSTLDAFFTLLIFSISFVASIECPDSTTLNGKSTCCTTS